MASNNLFVLQATIMLVIYSATITTSSSNPILDIDGNPLEAGATYYILPAIREIPYGGLNLSPRPNKPTCPNFVGIYTNPNKQGRPVTFSIPQNSSQNVITEDTFVTISFKMSYSTKCGNTGEWFLVSGVSYPGVILQVGLGRGDIATPFKIEKMGGTDPQIVNKIMVCFDPKFCTQLGVVGPGVPGLNILGLVSVERNLPFLGFIFKKALAPNQNVNYY